MDQNIRRGIDLQYRFGDTHLAKRLKNAFEWWNGGKINKTTFVGLTIVFFLNLYAISALFEKDMSGAFSSSVIFREIARVLSFFNVSQSYFFALISVISLSFVPISIYLFVRRVVHRHELTAFLAALLFVLPSPFLNNNLPTLYAFLHGDGAHVVTFSFIPFFLLYFKAFIQTGLSYWGFFSVIGTTLIVLLSPIATFNLLIFFFVLTIAEGLLGGFRVKLARLLFVLISSFGLSFFWYNPLALIKIVGLSNVQQVVSSLWAIFPLLIPLSLVTGIASFLIFDRRERLQPILISIAFCVAYIFIYYLSSKLIESGTFTPERFIVEFKFVQVFILALIIGFFGEYIYLRGKAHLKVNKLHTYLFFTVIFVIVLSVLWLFLVELTKIRSNIIENDILVIFGKGVGSVERKIVLTDATSILAGLISLGTLGSLIYLMNKLSRFPIDNP